MLACAAVSQKRVRRSPEAARAEILEAAEAALREHDLGSITVELLMERTGMTRSSFYHYFKRVDDVAVALFDRVEGEISGAVDDWLEREGDDPRADTVEHLTQMYGVWSAHAGLMRAMEQAAGRSGAAYEQWRGRVIEGYVERTTAFIRRQVAAGRSDVADPETLARALILMNVAVATDQVWRDVPATPERLGATVGHVWNRSIFGDS